MTWPQKKCWADITWAETRLQNWPNKRSKPNIIPAACSAVGLNPMAVIAPWWSKTGLRSNPRLFTSFLPLFFAPEHDRRRRRRLRSRPRRCCGSTRRMSVLRTRSRALLRRAQLLRRVRGMRWCSEVALRDGESAAVRATTARRGWRPGSSSSISVAARLHHPRQRRSKTDRKEATAVLMAWRPCASLSMRCAAAAR